MLKIMNNTQRYYCLSDERFYAGLCRIADARAVDVQDLLAHWFWEMSPILEDTAVELDCLFIWYMGPDYGETDVTEVINDFHDHEDHADYWA